MSKILIVEDEFPIGLELEELLDSHGYEVVGVASTGLEAISTARRDNPDLILMDIKLPGKVDGIDAAIKIRSELDIPSVFLTGYGKSEFVERAKAADPLGYILKPLNKPQILAGLELAIDKMHKEKAVRKAREKDALVIKKGAEALEKAKKRLLSKREAINDLSSVIDTLVIVKEASEQNIQKSVVKKKKSFPERSPGSMPDELLCLSPREFRIAQMIQKGKNSHQVGKTLNISTDTVNWHRKNIRKKLGLSNQKTALIVKLASLGRI
jgi:DNA-binding NarL/FixJ family response regulator